MDLTAVGAVQGKMEQEKVKRIPDKGVFTAGVHENLFAVSPIHGLNFIHKTYSWWEKFFWCFLMVVFLAVMARDMVNLAKQYRQQPTMTKVSMSFNRTMKPPPLTLCINLKKNDFIFRKLSNESAIVLLSTNLENITSRQEFLNISWQRNKYLLQTAYDYIATLYDFENDNLSDQNSLGNNAIIKILERFMKEKSISHTDLTKKFSAELVELLQLEATNQEIDYGDFIELSWMERQQNFDRLCFRLAYLGNISESESSIQIGLDFGNLATYSKSDKIKRGIKLSLQSGRKIGQFDNAHLKGALGESRSCSIEITAHFVASETAAGDSRCSLSVAREECMGHCKMLAIYSKCACFPVSWLGLIQGQQNDTCFFGVDYQKCSYQPSVEEETCRNECLPSCESWTYRLKTKGTEKNGILPSTAAFRLSFATFMYPKFTELESVSWQQYLGDAGGTLGLWFGASILSLIHLFVFGCRIAYNRAARRFGGKNDDCAQLSNKNTV